MWIEWLRRPTRGDRALLQTICDFICRDIGGVAADSQHSVAATRSWQMGSEVRDSSSPIIIWLAALSHGISATSTSSILSTSASGQTALAGLEALVVDAHLYILPLWNEGWRLPTLFRWTSRNGKYNKNYLTSMHAKCLSDSGQNRFLHAEVEGPVNVYQSGNLSHSYRKLMKLSSFFDRSRNIRNSDK